MWILRIRIWILALVVSAIGFACTNGSGPQENNQSKQTEKEVRAADILGNPSYPAISYGGYRTATRDVQPTLDELKTDMRILEAMGIKVLRTYNVHLPHAANLLQAIRELKASDQNFEMYVMLGIWINCENAFTPNPDHNREDSKMNAREVDRAVELALKYSDIVRVLAVGNEAMVRWAESYYVQPAVILKWVKYLQDLKKGGGLPDDLWITSSDDFASWGGGDPGYRVKDLEDLVREVDFVSMHTYPYHNTHYNPEFWGLQPQEKVLPLVEQIEAAMERALQFARLQFDSVSAYVNSIAPGKPVHIGETGWASVSSGHYGPKGSKATDELKQAIYYKQMREWTRSAGISCFYFEAFNEPWKDAQNPRGSENHFGLFTVDGKAKYALWDLVDRKIFEGLTRDGRPVEKTYNGSLDKLLEDVEAPDIKTAVTVGY